MELPVDGHYANTAAATVYTGTAGISGTAVGLAIPSTAEGRCR